MAQGPAGAVAELGDDDVAVAEKVNVEVYVGAGLLFAGVNGFVLRVGRGVWL